MARQRSRRKKPTSARPRRPVKSTPPPKADAAGPVTLAQARALAKVSAPLERGAKAALAPASPATVGFERRKLGVTLRPAVVERLAHGAFETPLYRGKCAAQLHLEWLTHPILYR